MSHGTVVKNDTGGFRPLDTTSVLRPARLACPECRRRSPNNEPELQTVNVGKASFYHCRACGGAWFLDMAVDDALLAAGTHVWPDPEDAKVIESLRKSEGSTDAIESMEGAMNCPCCRGNLVSINDRRGRGAVVRRCLVCYGGWIEYIGLRRAMETSGGLLSSMSRFMSGLLNG